MFQKVEHDSKASFITNKDFRALFVLITTYKISFEEIVP